MKKRFAQIISIMVCLGLILSFGVMLGCKKASSSKKMSTKQMYALAISAGATYFEDNLNTSPILLSENSDLSRPSIVDGDIEKLNKYVKMFEGYLLDGNTNISTTPPLNTDIGKTFGNYTVTENTVKQVITLPTLDGQEVVYTFYYTETITGQEDSYVDYNDENEVNSFLTGVAVLQDNLTFYNVAGTRETASEPGEYEMELKIEIKKSEKEYIVMEYSNEQEKNENEEEFEFYIYENGQLASSTNIEFEREGTKIEMELEFNEDVSDATHVVYKIKKDGQGFKVSFKNAQGKGTFRIEKVENGYKYIYSNGYTEIVTI